MRAMKLTAVLSMALAVQACASGTTRDAERQAAIDQGLREFCATQKDLPCRENVAFTLNVDGDGGTQSFAFELLPPPLQGGYLSLLPGETLYLTGDIVDGVLANLRAAREPFAAPHLVFRFEQEAGKPDMQLTASNRFDVPVKYRLVMMRTDSERLLKTSTCPVRAGGSALEAWPYAIFQLIVVDARVAADDELRCGW